MAAHMGCIQANLERFTGQYFQLAHLSCPKISPLEPNKQEIMDAARWLADCGFGNPTLNTTPQDPGIGDFTMSEL
ncbi:MAG: hypothetical protein CL731_08665 [Chloroflexi bacterium]|nr:hypothetical protein [Chloroflexota bacterium]